MGIHTDHVERFTRLFELACWLSNQRLGVKTNDVLELYVDYSPPTGRLRMVQRDLRLLKNMGLVESRVTGPKNVTTYYWIQRFRWTEIRQ